LFCRFSFELLHHLVVNIQSRLHMEKHIMKMDIWQYEPYNHSDENQRRPSPRELLRPAIPRRVYTQSHVDYIVEVVEEAFRRRERLKPFRILEQAPFLRHFTARYGMAD
jgi:tryptophanase